MNWLRHELNCFMPRRAIHVPQAQFTTERQFTRRRRNSFRRGTELPVTIADGAAPNTGRVVILHNPPVSFLPFLTRIQ
jgi:hypothetical protein